MPTLNIPAWHKAISLLLPCRWTITIGKRW
jgi:hypothetical protein